MRFLWQFSLLLLLPAFFIGLKGETKKKCEIQSTRMTCWLMFDEATEGLFVDRFREIVDDMFREKSLRENRVVNFKEVFKF